MWGRKKEAGAKILCNFIGGAKKGKRERRKCTGAVTSKVGSGREMLYFRCAPAAGQSAVGDRPTTDSAPSRALLAVANLPVTLLSAESPTGCSSRPFTVKLHKCSQFFLLVEPSHWLKGSIIHLQYKARGASPLILGPQTTECDWLFSSTLGIWHLALTPRFLQQSLACYPVSAAGQHISAQRRPRHPVTYSCSLTLSLSVISSQFRRYPIPASCVSVWV